MVILQRNEKREKKEKQVYLGIDVHKVKWVVSVYEGDKFVKTYSQSSSVEALLKYLEKHYSGSVIEVAYESGFSGYYLHRQLALRGISCSIVHAADIPSTDWERRRKSDKIDSRKLGSLLSRGLLKGIYVPSEEEEQIRELVRMRLSLSRDKRRYMCRIRSYMMRQGIDERPELKGKLWTKAGQSWLSGYVSAHPSLGQLKKMYAQIRQIELQTAKQLRQEIKQSSYAGVYECLLSIPGIGWHTASLLIGELGSVSRFKRLDELASYCGIVPDIRSSADRTKVLGMS